MVTLNDIAKAAGVSRGTVDRVLHGRGKVSVENERIIRKLAKEMGYQPDVAGKALAVKKKKFKIGFCYPDSDASPFHRVITKGARQYVPKVEQYGMSVHFFPVPIEYHEICKLKSELHQLVKDNANMDGWIVLGPLTTFFVDELKVRGLSDKPVVLCGNDVPSSDRLAFVGCDYFLAGKIACGLAAIATQEKGKVGIISLDDGKIASNTLRIAGFEDEIKNCYPKMEIVGKYFSYSQENYARFENQILNWINETTNIDILYIVNPGNYTICKSLFPVTQSRNIQIITNDLLSEEEREWIKDKKILGVICQNPDSQGKEALEIMFNYLAYGRKPDNEWLKAKLSLFIRQNV